MGGYYFNLLKNFRLQMHYESFNKYHSTPTSKYLDGNWCKIVKLWIAYNRWFGKKSLVVHARSISAPTRLVASGKNIGTVSSIIEICSMNIPRINNTQNITMSM